MGQLKMGNIPNQMNLDEILQNVGFKSEEIRNGELLGIETTEILALFNGLNIGEVLNELKKQNRTFELFEIMINHNFEEAKNKGISTTVNMYLKDFSNTKLIEEIERLETKYSIDNSKITLEVLEDNYGELDGNAIKNMKILKEKGFKIAIDDYILDITENNKSFLNLEMLMANDIIPEYVKLDGAYIQKILNNQVSQKEKETLINNIKTLKEKGIKIVGEWITDNREGIEAKKLGIDYFQGRSLTDDFCIYSDSNKTDYNLPKEKLNTMNEIENVRKRVEEIIS